MSKCGHIRLDDEVIRYHAAPHDDWHVALSDVWIIAECTNQDGPAADYFLCFSTGPGMWLEASFYAEGREDLLRDLGKKLGSPLETDLHASVDFASRILWPPALAGEPMFKYVRPQGGLLARIMGIGQKWQTYSDRVAAYLAEHDSAAR